VRHAPAARIRSASDLHSVIVLPSLSAHPKSAVGGWEGKFDRRSYPRWRLPYFCVARGCAARFLVLRHRVPGGSSEQDLLRDHADHYSSGSTSTVSR
jgi:hypothetical protein